MATMQDTVTIAFMRLFVFVAHPTHTATATITDLSMDTRPTKGPRCSSQSADMATIITSMRIMATALGMDIMADTAMADTAMADTAMMVTAMAVMDLETDTAASTNSA